MAQITTGTITTEEGVLTFVQFCDECNQKPERIRELVYEGVIEPQGHTEQDWQFDFELKLRAMKALRLQRDFELNVAGAALAVHLLDKIEELQRMLK